MNHAKKRILLMDDDAFIREVASDMLDDLGYTVTTCVNGEEAIRLYRTAQETGTPFLSVLMDLVIGTGMGGIEAAKEILKFDPDAKLFLLSGYSQHPVMSTPELYGFCGCIPKPFDIHMLRKKLETCL